MPSSLYIEGVIVGSRICVQKTFPAGLTVSGNSLTRRPRHDTKPCPDTWGYCGAGVCAPPVTRCPVVSLAKNGSAKLVAKHFGRDTTRPFLDVQMVPLESSSSGPDVDPFVRPFAAIPSVKLSAKLASACKAAFSHKLLTWHPFPDTWTCSDHDELCNAMLAAEDTCDVLPVAAVGSAANLPTVYLGAVAEPFAVTFHAGKLPPSTIWVPGSHGLSLLVGTMCAAICWFYMWMWWLDVSQYFPFPLSGSDYPLCTATLLAICVAVHMYTFVCVVWFHHYALTSRKATAEFDIGGHLFRGLWRASSGRIVFVCLAVVPLVVAGVAVAGFVRELQKKKRATSAAALTITPTPAAATAVSNTATATFPPPVTPRYPPPPCPY